MLKKVPSISIEFDPPISELKETILPSFPENADLDEGFQLYRTVAVALAHEQDRRTNMELLEQHGAHLWQKYIQEKKETLETLKCELKESKKKLLELNMQRKAEQIAAQKEIEQLSFNLKKIEKSNIYTKKVLNQ